MLNASHTVTTETTAPTLWFGVAFLLLGSAVSAIAARQYQNFIRTLTHPEIPRGHNTWLGPALNYALTLTGLAMAAWFVWNGG